MLDLNDDVKASEPDGGNQDNQDTLEVALGSKGLVGVFDHNFVEKHNYGKTRSVCEMGEGLKKVARRVARVLEESSGDCHKFEPTWTSSWRQNQDDLGGSCRWHHPVQSEGWTYKRV